MRTSIGFTDTVTNTYIFIVIRKIAKAFAGKERHWAALSALIQIDLLNSLAAKQLKQLQGMK